MTIGDRLKLWRARLGLSQTDVVEKYGIKRSSYQRYELDQSAPGAEAIQALVNAGLNANWLLNGIGDMLIGDKPTNEAAPASSPGIGDEFMLVTHVDVAASAGGGNVVESEPEIGKLAFRRDWLRQKGLNVAALAVIQIHGNSMAPTISDGALALIDTRQKAISDGIYVIQFDGLLMAKRLQRDFSTGGVFIRSDNTAYTSQHLTPEQAAGLYIVGKVVWAGCEYS